MCVRGIGQRRRVGIHRRKNGLQKESSEDEKAHCVYRKQKEVHGIRILEKTALCSALFSGKWGLSGALARPGLLGQSRNSQGQINYTWPRSAQSDRPNTGTRNRY